MPPHSIASLLASGTEILFGLGLGDRVVAISHECDFPSQALLLPRVTRSRIDARQSSRAIDDHVRSALEQGDPLYEIDADVLRQLRPELIVTQAQCDVCAVRYQDVVDLVHSDPQLARTAVVALNPMTLDEVLDDIRRIAAACQAEHAGDRYVADLRRRIQAVRQRTDELTVEQRPRVACIEWSEPLMLAANWTPQLIQWAGGRHELTETGKHSSTNDWSSVVHYDPDIVLVCPCGFDLQRANQELQTLAEHDGWRQLVHHRPRRVITLDGNTYLNRSGPRLVETLEILAHLIQPRLFAEPRRYTTPHCPWQIH